MESASKFWFMHPSSSNEKYFSSISFLLGNKLDSIKPSKLFFWNFSPSEKVLSSFSFFSSFHKSGIIKYSYNSLVIIFARLNFENWANILFFLYSLKWLVLSKISLTFSLIIDVLVLSLFSFISSKKNRKNHNF